MYCADVAQYRSFVLVGRSVSCDSGQLHDGRDYMFRTFQERKGVQQEAKTASRSPVTHQCISLPDIVVVLSDLTRPYVLSNSIFCSTCHVIPSNKNRWSTAGVRRYRALCGCGAAPPSRSWRRFVGGIVAEGGMVHGSVD